MGILSSLFGNKDKKIQDFVSRGAIIVDVRSVNEYQGGAIPGSVNMPLPTLSTKISEIKKWDKPVILCCASGIRSGSATGLLLSNKIEAMNGGGWSSLRKKL